MFRLKRPVATILCCWASFALAGPVQAGAPSAGSEVVATAGGHELTRRMLDDGVLFGEIMAGADFSPSDADAMRSALIAVFPKDTAAAMKGYGILAIALRRVTRRKPSWLDLAIIRQKAWQPLCLDDAAFQRFQDDPTGQIVLKYNPVLVRAGGLIVTRKDIDSRFVAEAIVAEAAGVAPPTDAEKEDFARRLPERFASLPKEEQGYLADAELRAVNVALIYNSGGRARAAMVADIRRNVHSRADVSRETRRVESDAQYDARYYRMYRSNVIGAIARANRAGAYLSSMGSALRGIARSSNISTPMH